MTPESSTPHLPGDGESCDFRASFFSKPCGGSAFSCLVTDGSGSSVRRLCRDCLNRPGFHSRGRSLSVLLPQEVDGVLAILEVMKR